MSIYWFLNGDEKNASSRLQGINIHNWYLKNDISSIIFHKPVNIVNDILINEKTINDLLKIISTQDIVIFQTIDGVNILKLATGLKNKGTRIVFVDCDLPLKENIAKIYLFYSQRPLPLLCALCG